MRDGFLGRWSRRKQEVRDGTPVVESPLAPSPQPSPASGRPRDQAAVPAAGVESVRPVSTSVLGEAPAESPPPTLQDAQALTPTSDFKPFMAQGVTADVRNAAMKKLFADPHFNVMDRLDIYIDDYNQPDPLPAAMLRQMASARFLNLVDDEEHGPHAGQPARVAGDDADTPSAPDVAQSVIAPDPPAPVADAGTPGSVPALTHTQDAHTDLRLQPDDAPRCESAGPGAA